MGSWIITGGLIPVCVVGNLGYMDPSKVDAAIRLVTPPNTGLICVENTHNSAGGTVLTPDQMKSTWEVARKYNIPVHLDGARIFNAAVYLKTDVKNLTKYTDSLSFCLSKGLSAPVGSVVCGTKEFIAKTRQLRKFFGGTMRQAGIIAAPGIIALTKMVNRLDEDHKTAIMLADGLRSIKGIKILHPVQTNIIRFDVGGLKMTADQFRDKIAKFGIRTGGGPHTDRARVKYTIECVKKMMIQ